MPTGGMFGNIIEVDRFCTKMVEENGTPEMKMLLSQKKVGYRALLPDDNAEILERFSNESATCLVRTDNMVNVELF